MYANVTLVEKASTFKFDAPVSLDSTKKDSKSEMCWSESGKYLAVKIGKLWSHRRKIPQVLVRA